MSSRPSTAAVAGASIDDHAAVWADHRRRCRRCDRRRGRGQDGQGEAGSDAGAEERSRHGEGGAAHRLQDAREGHSSDEKRKKKERQRGAAPMDRFLLDIVGVEVGGDGISWTVVKNAKLQQDNKECATGLEPGNTRALLCVTRKHQTRTQAPPRLTSVLIAQKFDNQDATPAKRQQQTTTAVHVQAHPRPKHRPYPMGAFGGSESPRSLAPSTLTAFISAPSLPASAPPPAPPASSAWPPTPPAPGPPATKRSSHALQLFLPMP